MYYLGCDLGSTAGKAVLLKVEGTEASIAAYDIEPSGFSPNETAKTIAERVCAKAGITVDDLDGKCCTGYGREHVDFIPENVSEISCHARGGHFLYPEVRTIIDVGGQDVKTIAVSGKGKVVDFAMNDKCAAGTGKFFEAMARTLRTTVQELGEMSLLATNPTPISSTCSVFAESEVITAINVGTNRNDIAGGIHESIARRLVAMVNRVGLTEKVALTGGCAKNPGLRKSLQDMLHVTLVDLPADPQINGALGAALFASDAAKPAEPLVLVQARPGDPRPPSVRRMREVGPW